MRANSIGQYSHYGMYEAPSLGSDAVAHPVGKLADPAPRSTVRPEPVDVRAPTQWLESRQQDCCAYLPEVGKYNAGQKFVFWSQTILVATLFITGLGLWETGLAYVEGLLGFKATIDQLRLAALIHAGAAVLAITIWIIHVYATIWVRGTISAMTRGFVTGGWGWRHHRKWLRGEVAKARSSGRK